MNWQNFANRPRFSQFSFTASNEAVIHETLILRRIPVPFSANRSEAYHGVS